MLIELLVLNEAYWVTAQPPFRTLIQPPSPTDSTKMFSFVVPKTLR